MYNAEAQIKRVIQLKPIQRPILEQENNRDEDFILQQIVPQLEEAKQELDTVNKQRESILADTKKQIQIEHENWQQEKVALMEQAKQEGYQAGFEQGKEESLNHYQALLGQANSIILAAKKDFESILDKSDESILILAVQVAEKILKQKLQEQPNSFLPIVRDAVQAIKDQRVLTIKLHPEQYEFVLEQKQELERILESKAELSIILNEGQNPGSCIIEHPFGKIDASVDTQLEQIKQALHEIVMEQEE